jgi:hypothetical protein
VKPLPACLSPGLQTFLATGGAGRAKPAIFNPRAAVLAENRGEH